MIKFVRPNKNQRSAIASSSGYYEPGPNQNNHKFAGATTSQVPITKNAQYAGSGANVIWTQPMFFSPLHTPQNWQIASKRKEIYQWQILSGQELTLPDHTQIPVEEFMFFTDSE